VRRVTSTDETEVMPPPSTGKKLTAKQLDTLRRWVASGAKYQVHWAFVAPRRPPLPPVRDAGWARNPIARFVLPPLQTHGPPPRGPARAPAPPAPAPPCAAAPRRPPRWTPSSPTPGPTPTSAWWTGCWRRRTTANAGAGTGSTPPATPTATASRRTSRATPGC